MEAGADEIVALARSLVPVSSGALRNSIGWTWGDAPDGSLILGSVRKISRSRRKIKTKADVRREAGLAITIYAGDDEAFYARWVEFGTQATQARGSRRNNRFRNIFVATKEYRAHAATPAQPFFYPAYRALRKSVKSRIRRAANKAAKLVAAGVVRG